MRFDTSTTQPGIPTPPLAASAPELDEDKATRAARRLAIAKDRTHNKSKKALYISAVWLMTVLHVQVNYIQKKTAYTTEIHVHVHVHSLGTAMHTEGIHVVTVYKSVKILKSGCNYIHVHIKLNLPGDWSNAGGIPGSIKV